jgi:hypothetical protein
MTPLRICCFILMGVITVFFLLLISVAMVRILRAPLQEDVDSQNGLAVDILVTDNIPITEKDIAFNQNLTVVSGMSVLVCQNSEEDGLYLVDATNALIRVDCVKTLGYHITTGKHQDLIYKPSSKQLIQDNIMRRVFETNTSLTITEHVAELLLFLKKDVKEVSLQYTDICCLLRIMNATDHDVTIVSKFQKQSISVSPGHHHLSIIDNVIKLDGKYL